MPKLSNYFVVGLYGDSNTPVHLDGYTLEAARRAKAWQGVGAGQFNRFTIAQPVAGKLGTMLGIDGDQLGELSVTNGGWTVEAWDRFTKNNWPLDAHNPDTNSAWRPLVANRVYACDQCGTEQTIQTNHTGKVWAQRCAGPCRTILNPHTENEKVLPYVGPHHFVRVATDA